MANLLGNCTKKKDIISLNSWTLVTRDSIFLDRRPPESWLPTFVVAWPLLSLRDGWPCWGHLSHTLCVVSWCVALCCVTCPCFLTRRSGAGWRCANSNCSKHTSKTDQTCATRGAILGRFAITMLHQGAPQFQNTQIKFTKGSINQCTFLAFKSAATKQWQCMCRRLTG